MQLLSSSGFYNRLGWDRRLRNSQSDLAGKAGVSRATIADFETGKRQPIANNLAAIQNALETGGAQFIPENGGGAGVRLKFNRREVKAIDKLENEGGIVADDDV